MKISDQGWKLIHLVVVAVIVTAPSWMMADTIDTDEYQKAGAAGAALALIFGLKKLITGSV